MAKMDRILEHTEMKPKYPGLKSTETAVMLNFDITYNVWSQLSERGIRISVEGLGTGYAAFNYLKTWTVKSLKIDRSFVHDLASASSDRSIANTLAAMAPGLNLGTIPQEIEIPAQWQ